jgi:hypothetical protein
MAADHRHPNRQTGAARRHSLHRKVGRHFATSALANELLPIQVSPGRSRENGPQLRLLIATSAFMRSSDGYLTSSP